MDVLQGNLLSTSPLGVLEWKRDLINFDGPLLAEYISDKDEIYLKYWCDCDENHNRWMLFKIKEQQRLRLVLGEISLQQVILQQPDCFVFFCDENDIEEKYQMVMSENIPQSYLPAEDSFLDIEDYQEDENITSLIFENQWELETLKDLFRKFSQIYDFLFVANQITRPLGVSMPWQGGFSSVHFYNKIKALIPQAQRSGFNAIHYASPGYIKISVDRKISNITLSAINHYALNKSHIDTTYSTLKGRIATLELNHIEANQATVEFQRDDQCLRLYSTLCTDLGGFNKQWLDAFVETHFEKCKMVMAHYRRVKMFNNHLDDQSVRVVSALIHRSSAGKNI